MFMKITQISKDPTLFMHQNDHFKSYDNISHTLLQNPSSNLAIISHKDKQGFHPMSARLLPHNKAKRKFAIYSSVQPGVPPSGPPQNISSWIVAGVIAIVIPLLSYKWGPMLKNKVESALKTTEDVVEAVEKVAEEVEKAVEDIADDLPEGGKFREAIDYVENLAEKAAKDAGAVDDFIDQVQEEEEKAEQFAKTLKLEAKKPPKESDGDNSGEQNLNK